MTDSESVDYAVLEKIHTLLEKKIEKRSNTVMENHAQTIVVFLILCLLGWVGYSILELTSKSEATNLVLTQQLAETKSDIKILSHDMQYLRSTMDKAASNHVTVAEFVATRDNCRKDLDSIDRRIKDLEKIK